MRPIHRALACSALTLFACSGLPADATTDSPGLETGAAEDSGPEEGVHQTGSCRDYLACLEGVDEDEARDQEDKYGESGSCWAATTEVMEGCDAECEEKLAELVEDGEDCESSGGGDTGGDTGGGGGGCPLDEGAYSSSLTFEVDDCGFGEISDLALSVTCEGTEMSLVSDVFALRFPCETGGADFSCVIEDGFYMEIAGTANGAGDRANGSFRVEGPCESLASLTMSR